MDPNMIHGEWMGVVKFSNKMVPALKQAMQKLKVSSDFDVAKFHDLFSFWFLRGTTLELFIQQAIG
jgi:hypothetical protein